jgi:hypothetical protein
MLAIDYINSRFICGLDTDSDSTLKNYFEEQKVTHLPISDNYGHFKGVLYAEDLVEWTINKDFKLINEFKCNIHQHIFECLEIMVANNLSCLAAVDDSNVIKGVITLYEIMLLACQMAVISVPGAIFVIEVPARDYTLAQISQIVEFNGAKIIALHTEHSVENTIKLTLKINTKETTSIMQSFRRYDYNVISHYIGTDSMEQFYHNRIDELLRYINF